MDKRKMDKLASAVAKAEGKKKQVTIGNIREVLRILDLLGALK